MRTALRLLCFLGCGIVFAADPLPPKPARYVEDQAGLLSAPAREALNLKLEAFERATSSQVLVGIFPSVPEDYAMEDFTQHTAEAWGVGQKATDNGVVFFIFPKDRKLRIEVGYGLEGAIPDATAKAILDHEVTPRFRSGNFDAGVTRGVDSILAAARGEYKGTGRSNADGNAGDDEWVGLLPLSIVFLALFFLWRVRAGGGTSYGRGDGAKVPGPTFLAVVRPADLGEDLEGEARAAAGAASAVEAAVSEAEARAEDGKMKPKEFIAKLDDARVVAAIAEAERKTSGEIRVFVSGRALGHDEVQKRAEARFEKLGMTATSERNGVLFYFIPRDRKFAIIGDRGINEKCGSGFWAEIAEGLHVRLARGEFTDGVVEAIGRAGAALKAHFPEHREDRNELPDEIERD